MLVKGDKMSKVNTSKRGVASNLSKSNRQFWFVTSWDLEFIAHSQTNKLPKTLSLEVLAGNVPEMSLIFPNENWYYF